MELPMIIALIVAFVALALAFVVAVVETKRMPARSLFVFVKVFGLHLVIAQWVGNCFSPAVVLTWRGLKSKGAKATLTLRFKHKETVLHWYGWTTGWNSEHIAMRYGKEHEADHGVCYFYKGWLGSHQSV